MTFLREQHALDSLGEAVWEWVLRRPLSLLLHHQGDGGHRRKQGRVPWLCLLKGPEQLSYNLRSCWVGTAEYKI